MNASAQKSQKGIALFSIFVGYVVNVITVLSYTGYITFAFAQMRIGDYTLFVSLGLAILPIYFYSNWKKTADQNDRFLFLLSLPLLIPLVYLASVILLLFTTSILISL